MLKQSNGRAWKSVVVLAAVLILMAPAALRADVIYIQVDAVSGGDGSSYLWAVPKNLDENGKQTWMMTEPLTLAGSGGATVNGLSLTLAGDPGVSLGFSVVAGLTDQTFTITSSIVSFAAIVDPLAYASAAITLTDTDGNGASLTGQYAGGKSYEARYNVANTVFTHIIDSFSAAAESSEARALRDPVSGRTLISASVTQIQSQFNFLLTANDQASGTSRFDIIEQPIPEPGTLLLVGSGVLTAVGLLRRRRMQ